MPRWLGALEVPNRFSTAPAKPLCEAHLEEKELCIQFCPCVFATVLPTASATVTAFWRLGRLPARILRSALGIVLNQVPRNPYASKTNDRVKQRTDRKKIYKELRMEKAKKYWDLLRGLNNLFFSDGLVCLINSKNFPQAQRKRKKQYERSYETEKDKTRTTKIFLIGSPEKKHRADVLCLEKMLLFSKQEGLVVTGGDCTFYRSARGKGLCLKGPCLKRLWKVQGKLPFCDRHSHHHIELPILPLLQSPIETAENKKK